MLDYSSLYSVELPSRLIKEIPKKTDIDELRLKLIRIFDDYRFQLSLQQGTRLGFSRSELDSSKCKDEDVGST